MKKEKKILITLSGLLLFVLMIIGFSYAYYSANIIGNETSTTITGTASTLSLSFTDGTDKIVGSNIAPGWSASKTFTVANTGTGLANYKLRVYDVSNPLVSGGITITYTSTNDGASLSNYALGTTEQLISQTIPINSGVSQVYTLTVNYINLDADQSSDLGKAFSFKIGIIADNTSAIAKVGTASDSIKALAGLTSGIGGLKTIAHAATGNQTYATTDYRYYGSNPNNYVTFNDELWRIIGVFEVENEYGTKEYRVKLIRNDIIGYYSYDTSASTVNGGYGINEWSQADLMKLLNPGYESNQDLNNSGATITVNNSLYWTKGSGTCYNGNSNATTTCDFTSTGLGATAKSMIDKTKYYIGGWNNNNITSTQFYTYERGSNVAVPGTTCSGTYCNDTVTRTTTWTGYVGLPYVSDYGYATDESLCLSAEKLYYSTTNGYYGHAYCHTNDWMWKSSSFYWTIMPISSDAYSVLAVHTAGSANYYSAYNANGASSVLYLKSSIKISGGKGTQTSPYTLSL
jgi:hypothetical protein